MNDTCNEDKRKELKEIFDKLLYIYNETDIDSFKPIYEENKENIKNQCAIDVFCNEKQCLDDYCRGSMPKYYGLKEVEAFNIYPKNICDDEQEKKKIPRK
jgi:hypothetical protein